MKTESLITITADIEPDHAEALAQLCKRASFNMAQRMSDPRNTEEPYKMLAALEIIGRSLARKGYAPR